MTVARLVLCLVFALYANVTDWKNCKIPNKASVSFLLLGLAVQLFTDGIEGLMSGFGGAAVMLVLFPLFALRMLGAGDVKALMAIGAMAGWPVAGSVLISSILGGGVLAMGAMLVRKNGLRRLRYFWNYLKMCFFTQSIHSYTPKLESGESTFRFSFGITLGVLITLVQYIF